MNADWDDFDQLLLDVRCEGLPATTPDRALEIGRAAEHLVCADLILQGHMAFLTEQGLPYDVVVDLGGRMLRIQVKATATVRNVQQRVSITPRYMWSVRRAGKGFSRVIGNDEFEVLALVALDIREIAYLPITDKVRQTVHLKPPGLSSRERQKAGSINKCVNEYPFMGALKELGL